MSNLRDRLKENRKALKTGDWDYNDAEFPRSMWGDEASSGTTQLGYFDWVLHQMESEPDCGGN
jgi:hypothetical protein